MSRTSNRELWEKRVARWRDSGLTAREFAAEIGVNQHTLTTWSSRLTCERRKQDGGSSKRVKQAPAGAAPSAALEFKEATASVRQAGSSCVFEVMVGAVIVRVPEGFDAASLSRLLAVVGAAS